MNGDELRDAIAGALYVRDRFDSPTVVLADAILALPEMQAMLADNERLRAEREAIEALHQPQEALDEYLRPEQWCPACANYWPCPTYLLLHPEEARHA